MAKIMQAKMKIPFKWVAITAYAILIVPILIFFFGWLKWYLAVLFSGILLFGAFWMIKKDYWNNGDKIEIPIIHFVFIIAAFGLWVAMSGSCGIGDETSNYDVPWRTAYLRDLIENDWPVFFPENNSCLCYYFAFWLVPAVFGKLFGISFAFFIQWVWLLLIVTDSFLLITYILKDYSFKAIWTAALFIIMWSGMNTIGTMILDIFGKAPCGIGMHSLEGWCDALVVSGEPFNFQYRSNQIILEQPYNQIPIWIAVPLFLQNRKIHNFAMIGLLILPFSPWGTIGLGILMIVYFIRYCIKNKNFKNIIREVFSVQNICSVLSIFIVFGFFFSSNSKTSSSTGGGFGMLSLNKFDFAHIMELILFWLLEFGIYCLLIRQKYKKDFLFKSIIPVLMLIPFFWIGGSGSRDFCMNVSQPILYILMIYMIGYVKDEVAGKKLNIRNLILIICLASAACSPIFDFGLKAKIMYANKSISVKNDWFYTYSNKPPETISNQVVSNPEETKFFKYLAKDYDRINPVSENLSDIKSIDDIDEYFDYLAGKDCTVYIAVQDIQGYSLTPEIIDKIKSIGFDDNLDALAEKQYHSFIGIVNNGKIVTEQLGGDEHIVYSDKVDGYPVTMESATLNTGNFSVINIKGRDYSVKGRGLNIVVKDNQTGCVIDNVAFDTHVDEMTCLRQQ